MCLHAMSKVALEKTAEVRKLEQPRVRFTTMVIGSTGGTAFFANAERPQSEDRKRFMQGLKGARLSGRRTAHATGSVPGARRYRGQPGTDGPGVGPAADLAATLGLTYLARVATAILGVDRDLVTPGLRFWKESPDAPTT
jgi:hypothetical protein